MTEGGTIDELDMVSLVEPTDSVERIYDLFFFLLEIILAIRSKQLETKIMARMSHHTILEANWLKHGCLLMSSERD